MLINSFHFKYTIFLKQMESVKEDRFFVQIPNELGCPTELRYFFSHEKTTYLLVSTKGTNQN